MKYTEELDKVSYCFGLSIASNLLSSGVNSINTEAFICDTRKSYRKIHFIHSLAFRHLILSADLTCGLVPCRA